MPFMLPVLDYSNNENGVGREQVVSLTFDSSVEPKPCPVGGSPLTLLLSVAGAMPAADGDQDSDYGDSREFFVSCTWETGQDDTLVDCSSGTGLAVLANYGSTLILSQSGSTCDARISNLE